MACRMAKIEIVESTILTQTLESVSLSFVSPPFYNVFTHSDHQCADNTEIHYYCIRRKSWPQNIARTTTNSIKVVVLSKFLLESVVEMEKLWVLIKMKKNVALAGFLV